MSRTATRLTSVRGTRKVSPDAKRVRRPKTSGRSGGKAQVVSRPAGRQKLSVSIPADMAKWVQAEADRRQVSVSYIFVDAIARARRQRAWDEYLKQAGEDDIAESDVATLREELRAGGVDL